jgi:hypothetical protein
MRQEYYYFPPSVHLVTFGKIGTRIHSERAKCIIKDQMNVSSGMFRVVLSFSECARYLATRKILENY